MNAIIKVSGVSASGLAELHKFLEERGDLYVNPLDDQRRFVSLKDVHLEDDKTKYLVTMEMILVDGISMEKMSLGLMVELMQSMNHRLLPKFDRSGDGERNLKEFEGMIGKPSPFEVKDRETSFSILQKGQRVTLGRLEEIVTIPIGGLSWTTSDSQIQSTDVVTAQFNKLLCWMNEGGISVCEFRRFTI